MYSGFNPRVQITPTNVAVIDGVSYEIKATNDGVELIEIVEE